MIRKVKLEDLSQLAVIYKSLYDNIDAGLYWTLESAYNYFKYYYDIQKDLFFVAEYKGKVIGAILSRVQPYIDGYILNDTDIFVAKQYQKGGG